MSDEETDRMCTDTYVLKTLKVLPRIEQVRVPTSVGSYRSSKKLKEYATSRNIDLITD
jgi:hypothetical protein